MRHLRSFLIFTVMICFSCTWLTSCSGLPVLSDPTPTPTAAVVAPSASPDGKFTCPGVPDDAVIANMVKTYQLVLSKQDSALVSFSDAKELVAGRPDRPAAA